MKIGNIEVTGIENVVFTRENTHWFRDKEDGKFFWRKTNGDANLKSDEGMIRTINYFADHPNAKVWIHDNYVNIVTRLTEAPKPVRIRYIGPAEIVTECDRREKNIDEPSCVKGICPGYINGGCPFYVGGKVNPAFADYFVQE